MSTFTNIAILSSLLPALVLLFRFMMPAPKYLAIAILLVVSVVIEVMFKIFETWFDFTFFLISLYTVLEFGAFAYFFYRSLPGSTRFIQLFSALFIVVVVLNAIFIPGLYLDTVPVLYASLFFGAISLFYFKYLMSVPYNPLKSTDFWIVSGIFIYFSVSFFAFFSTFYFPDMHLTTKRGLWSIHQISRFVAILLIFGGFLQLNRKPAGG